MKTKLTWAAVAILSALAGCGSAATMPRATMPTVQTASVIDPMVLGLGTSESPMVQAGVGLETATLDLSALPTSPWSAERIAMSDAPLPILRAWEGAENRATCAPIAPRSFGAATGARGRATELSGGWAVEFDRRGLPGVDRNGDACDTCGRGVFGIAGTSLTPEDLVGEDSNATAPIPTYSDGSYAELEIEGEDAGEGAAASVTVIGQGCVYQVWSFLGADHVEALVSELRLVELPLTRSDGAIAAVDR